MTKKSFIAYLEDLLVFEKVSSVESLFYSEVDCILEEGSITKKQALNWVLSKPIIKRLNELNIYGD